MSLVRGFIIFADGPEYIKQAYLCAMSIRASKNKYPVSIITCDLVPDEYAKVFEHIIPIPDYQKEDSRFQTEHRWKVYDVSPYDETVVLDADVLVLEDLEYFWALMKGKDIYYTTNVNTYRQEIVTNDFYRKVFTANGLPNVYNTLHFFRKCDKSKEFFTTLKFVSNNWKTVYQQFCKSHMPTTPSMDVTAAIAALITETDVTNNIVIVTHMKPLIQNWRYNVEKWNNYVGVYLTDDLTLKIGNHRQRGVFHYTESNFVTDEVIRRYVCQS